MTRPRNIDLWRPAHTLRPTVRTRALAATLLACASSPSPPTTPADAPAKDVVLIVIDTLRADALGPANTPTLDALAARGEAAAVAWSGGTWTVPSVISLFTGAPVRQHGWDGPTGQQGRYPKLPALPTLAETFRAAGFTTIGLYANVRRRGVVWAPAGGVKVRLSKAITPLKPGSR